jgi:hypothetical protein
VAPKEAHDTAATIRSLRKERMAPPTREGP